MTTGQYQWRDNINGRAVARLVKHGDDVFIETEGNHNGQVVFTAVRIPRVEFAYGVRHIGGLL